MDITTFLGLLIMLQCMCLWVGKRAAKDLHSQEDYFLASKEVNFFPLLMTFIATQLGGGLVLGAAEEAYRFGWTVLLYPIGACLGFLILAFGVGKKLSCFPVSTVAELLEVVYGSSLLKKMGSLLSILSLLMILIAQVIASRKFMTSLGVENIALFLVFWGIVITYTVLGGLKAVVFIDIIQALFFITVFAFGFGYILHTQPFSVSNVIESGLKEELFDFGAPKMGGWLLMPMLFMVIEQDMAQRCFAASSLRVITRAATYAAVCTFLISIIPIYLGILGKQMGIDVPVASSVFMDVTQVLTNPYLAAFIGCAILMALLSTSISLLNAVSSNLSQDFNFGIKKGDLGVRSSRRKTAVIGLLAVAGSFYAGEIVDLLIQSYELSVYCLLVPVSAALIKPRGQAISAWMAFLFGAIGFSLTRFISFDIIPKEVICIALSAAGFSLTNLWIRLKNQATTVKNPLSNIKFF